MKKLTSSSGVDNTARRAWDKEEYTDKAAEREKKAVEAEETALDARKRKRLERDPLHQGLIVERSMLKARDHQVDLASRLNKTQVIGLNTPLNQQAGFYCSVCDCVLRDSQSYLDHINGKYHNRALGMTMRVEKSTVEQVRDRLKLHKDKAAASTGDQYLPDGIDRRLLEAQAAEEAEREAKKQRKKDEKRKKKEGKDGLAEDDDEGADPDMMALMGFGGFGAGK